MVVMEPLTDVLAGFYSSFVGFLPGLVAAIVLLIVGLIIGRIISRITKEVMIRCKVDQYVLREKKPLFRLSDVFSIIFKWSIYFLFIWAAVGTLKIPALTEIMQAIVMNFLPGLIKAVIVIVAGYLVAEYIRKQVEISKLMYSSIVGNILFWLTIYVAVAIALPLIGIDPTLVNNMLLIIFGAFGIGVGIAIGLGLKDTVAQLAAEYRKKMKTPKT
ncbi:MAG: hypothetical protein QMD14_01945 [Candidatus Aenigmarchaeota archaeon]|nr:hypothetical protein [Candidatus Aenigmarchaeota archaeon]